MKTLQFISILNQTLLEAKENSVNHLLYVENDYSLFKQIKEFVYKHINEDNSILKNNDTSQFLIDYLNRDNFKNRIRYAIIKINEFGIKKEEYFYFISESIKKFLHNDSDSNVELYRNRIKEINLNELIINELTNCFRIWYYPRDIFYIDFSEKRQLAIKDSHNKSWHVSNLGNYFMKLSPFEAVSFLLAIEVVLNNDKGYSKFINIEMIDRLLENEEKGNRRFYGEPYSLKALGIIENNHPRFRNQLTEFGRKIVEGIKNNYDKYKDLILFLLESEPTGLNFDELDDLEELSSWLENSWILKESQKKTIKKALSLYREDYYFESLNSLFPQLEATLNNALNKINFAPDSLKGMQNKVEKLKKEKILTSKTSTGLEIFSSRNKFLHGNIIEEDSETLKPLFSLVLTYFRKVAKELENNLNKE